MRPRSLVLLGSLLIGGCRAEPEVAGPPPVILIGLDTMRPDRLGAYGDVAGLTPNLDRFAAEAAVFESAWAQAGETLFSHASLFTGRYPSELHQLTYEFTLPEQTPTLASILGAYGYRSAASVAGGQLDPAFELDRGFDRYEVEAEWGSLYHTVPPALAWLDGLAAGGAPEPGGSGLAAPFLLFVHGYDAHHRYLKPAPLGLAEADPTYRGVGREIAASSSGTSRIVEGRLMGPVAMRMALDFRRPRILDPVARDRIRTIAARDDDARTLSDEDVAYLRDVYDGAVGYADAMFGLLMAGLEARGVLDRAVVVVFSDHGESLGEDGVFNHRYTMHDTDLQTVLMIRTPDAAPRRIAQPVGLIDLLPTLLELAGAAPPAEQRGRSLVPLLRGEPEPAPRGPVFSEGTFRQVSARSDAARLTFSGAGADSPFLTDLIALAAIDGPAFELEAAPGGAGPTRADAEALRDALVDWREGLSPTPAADPNATSPLRDKLRDAGYWGVP